MILASLKTHAPLPITRFLASVCPSVRLSVCLSICLGQRDSQTDAKSPQLGYGDLSLSYCVQLRKYKFLTKCVFFLIISTTGMENLRLLKCFFEYSLDNGVPANVFMRSLLVHFSLSCIWSFLFAFVCCVCLSLLHICTKLVPLKFINKST